MFDDVRRVRLMLDTADLPTAAYTAKINDALGARPDSPFRTSAPAELDAVDYGRAIDA